MVGENSITGRIRLKHSIKTMKAVVFLNVLLSSEVEGLMIRSLELILGLYVQVPELHPNCITRYCELFHCCGQWKMNCETHNSLPYAMNYI